MIEEEKEEGMFSITFILRTDGEVPVFEALCDFCEGEGLEPDASRQGYLDEPCPMCLGVRYEH